MINKIFKRTLKCEITMWVKAVFINIICKQSKVIMGGGVCKKVSGWLHKLHLLCQFNFGKSGLVI